MAMAARNSGGIVIAQVRQLATRGSLPHARRQGAGRARRPRLRRPRPVADVHHPGLAVLRGRRCAGRSRPEPPLPLDVRKIIARRSLLEFPPRRDLQPRLRDQPAHRPGGLGGGHHRPARADRRAGDLRRRAGGRQRGRRRVQLPGDDRPAVHVRLLRRRRARHREPVVRRGGRRGQRQRPRLRGPGPRAGRLPEHQRAGPAGSTSSGRSRRRASSSRSTAACGSSTEGEPRQVRAARSARSRSTAGSPASAGSRSATSPSARCSRSRTTASC